MKKLAYSLIAGYVLTIALTIALLLEIQGLRKRIDGSEDAVPKSGVSDVRGLKSIAPVYLSKEKYAFLVAVSDYAEVSPLNYSVNDVEDLKARLLELGFREENIVVLHSKREVADIPTKENIEARYRLLLDRVKKGDLVFVYLSGHGLQLEGSDVSYFAPTYLKLDNIPNTAVSINEMMEQLSESSAEFRWMIVDACRNVPGKSIFSVKTPGVKGLTSLENVPKSIALLQSCQPGKFSYEGGGTDHSDVHNSVFTLALLEALGKEGKGDLNGDGSLSFLEICQYVIERTNALAKDYHKVEQKPNLRGDITDFPFIEGLAEVEAERLYQEAHNLICREDYSSALEKIRLACQKQPEYQQYADIKEILKKLTGQGTDDDAFPGTRKTLTYNGVKFTFCYCPAGTFTMGSPLGEDRNEGEVLHEVKLTKGFWIQETELTQSQWDAIGIPKVEECRFLGGNLPVETVSWDECVAYVNKLNELEIAPQGMKFSLPTEAQWEYACRAGTQTTYFWGESLNGDKANCDGNFPCGTTLKGNFLEETSPVKTYDPNQWGLYDMHGNVYEWCIDGFGDYPATGRDVTDPVGTDDFSFRVVRGGSWGDDANRCRSAFRSRAEPANRNDCIGFRLVLN